MTALTPLARKLGAEGEGTPRHLALAPHGHSKLIETLFETSLEALLLVDDTRHYVRVNEPAVRLLGAPRAEILTRRIDHFTPREHLLVLQGLWNQLQSAGRLEGPYEVLRGDGIRSPIHFRAVWDLEPGSHLIAALPLPQPDGLRNNQPGDEPLSRREREVLQLIAAGHSNAEVAEKLVLSAATVKTHLQNAYRKLGVHGRAAAVAALLQGR